jgi:hypothetical protein
MTAAQGINKQTVIKKQVGLGSPASGAGGQILRRRTSVFTAKRNMFANDEIVSHQQSTGETYGLKAVDGKIDGLLSPATYKLLMAAVLRKDFANGATTGALTNVTAAVVSGASFTLTRAAGSYLTDGFKVGDVCRVTGFTTTGATDNSRNFLITSLTALVMTAVFLDGNAATAKASGDSVTIAVVGKKTLAPLTGHTNDYFTVEEWYPDVSESEVFEDTQFSQLQFGLPATGNATFQADALGLRRTRTGAQVLTTPTSETTTSVLTAVHGAVYVNGVIVGDVTGAQITVTGNMKAGEAVLGSNESVDIQKGRIAVSGNFTGLFTDGTLSDFYDAETVVSLILVVSDSTAGTSDFIALTMGAIKITGDAPDDGEKNIVRTYPFTAQINGSGGSALAWDKTVLSIQDSAA